MGGWQHPAARGSMECPDPLDTQDSFSHGGHGLEGATQGSPIPHPSHLPLLPTDGPHLSWETSQAWVQCGRGTRAQAGPPREGGHPEDPWEP